MNLMKSKQFVPFFWTQFLGAFNDNVFKNALLILIAFNSQQESESALYINLASGLFILPFFLFSSFAGQLADKYEKSKLIQITKIVEIIIMLMAAIGFFIGSNLLLILILFFMGTQSTFFGPVKYSILPQHLTKDELMEGTSLVEMGTFVAILLGTIVGGLLIKQNVVFVSVALIIFAIIGWLVSRKIPNAEATNPSLIITVNPWKQITSLIKIAKQNYSVWLSIIGISWFWFFGATFLAQLPNFVKYFIHGDEYLVTFFLAVFTISMAVGSLLCNKLADTSIELGLISFGAFGLSIFAFDLSLVDYSHFNNELLSFSSYFKEAGLSHYRVIVDLSLIGIFGSFFIVPLYALVQHRSKPEVCSQVIAANNILNAIFMVGSAVMTMLLFTWGLGPINNFQALNTVEVFRVVAILNLLVAIYILLLLPEFFLRFGIWIMARTVYKLRYKGRKKFPSTGPVLVVANHISFIDWFVLSAACQRPIRFVMDHRIFKVPILNFVFKMGKCIPIASKKDDLACFEKAFVEISEALDNGEVVGVFPEGMISHDGGLNSFKPGVDIILSKNKVPVVPIVISGLWGSFFSRKNGQAMKKIPKPSKRKVQIKILDVMNPRTNSSEMHSVIESTLKKLEKENV